MIRLFVLHSGITELIFMKISEMFTTIVPAVYGLDQCFKYCYIDKAGKKNNIKKTFLYLKLFYLLYKPGGRKLHPHLPLARWQT